MTLQAGNFTIEPIVDVEGTFFPLQVVFPEVALVEWDGFRHRYPDTFSGSDMLYTRVNCFLLRGHGQTILIDAGIGAGPVPLFGNERGRLLDELARLGLTAADIDTVVLTHLHPDHVGWAAFDGRPTFPRARYIVSDVELETFHRDDVRAAMEAIAPGYLDACLAPLERAGVLDVVEPEAELLPGLTLALAPGHTPGMLRIQLTGTEASVWIVADTFTHPGQVMRPEWCSAFDMDREQAIATRQATAERAEREGIAILASHFPPVAGVIVREADHRVWRPMVH